MCTLNAFEILLFENRSVLGAAERVPGSESVNFSVENQKTFSFCWNCFKSYCITSLEGFEWFLDFLDLV